MASDRLIKEREREIACKEEKLYYKIIENMQALDAWSKIVELRKELGQEGINMRSEYLKEILSTTENILSKLYQEYKFLVDTNAPYIERAFIPGHIDKQEKELKKIKMSIRIIKGINKSEITPDMIINARNYPISNLIDSKKNMACCPFHKDKNPSMSIRNNYYFCFGCGEQGDVIDFVMRTKGINFVSAVKMLC